MPRRIEWSVLLTFLLLLIAIGSFLIAWSDIRTSFAIYWFDVNYLQWRRFFACLVIPVAIIILSLWMVLIKKSFRVRLWLFPILFAGNVIACVACIPGAAYANEHEDSVIVGNRTYDAMFTYAAHGPNDDFEVVVYECDQFNFLCQIIFSHDVSSDGRVNMPTKATLIPDSATSQIALRINGETVFTHKVG